MFTIMEKVLAPLLDKLEALVQNPSRDKEWENDFCRYSSHLRYSLAGLNELYLETPEMKIGAESVEQHM